MKITGDKIIKVKRKNNSYRITNDVVYIKCGDKEAIIDYEDFSRVEPYYWSLTKYGYVTSLSSNIRLHNIIMGITKHDFNREVDHINRDKLDNRKSNLRLVNRQINNLNTGNQKNNKSCGLKGVSYHKQYGKWRAYIMLDYKQILLGWFDNPEDAYKVRLEYENKLLNELIDKYNMGELK